MAKFTITIDTDEVKAQLASRQCEDDADALYNAVDSLETFAYATLEKGSAARASFNALLEALDDVKGAFNDADW